MPAQMKRPAAAASSPAKAARKAAAKEVDPTTLKCNAISETIESAANYPVEVKEMLAGCVKRCLEVQKDARHDVQNEVITMIGEVLNSVEAFHTEKVAALANKVAAADTEKAAREAAAEAAETAAGEKAEALQAIREAILAAKVDIFTAREELSTSMQEQQAGAVELEEAVGKKALAEGVVSGALAQLKSGAAADAAAAVAEVMEVGKKLGLEAQLLASGTIALGKASESRSSFDGLVVGQVDEGFSVAMARLTGMIANGEAITAERAAKVDACNAKVETAEAHVKSLQEQREAAQVALKEAETAKKEATRGVKNFGPEMEVAGVEAETAKGPLAACKEVIASFKLLVEGPPAESEVALVEQGEGEGEGEVAEPAGEAEAAADAA